MATVLRSQGHEVAVENDAEKTIARVAARRPDAIILDVMFPENDTAGFEMARSVRRKFGDLPVLLLTAVNQPFRWDSATRTSIRPGCRRPSFWRSRSISKSSWREVEAILPRPRRPRAIRLRTAALTAAPAA